MSTRNFYDILIIIIKLPTIFMINNEFQEVFVLQAVKSAVKLRSEAIW